MADTPSPSTTPRKVRERTPITLTPRSKVAAMLKDFEDSDSETESEAKKQTPTAAAANGIPNSTHQEPQTKATEQTVASKLLDSSVQDEQTPNQPDVSDEEDEEDEEDEDDTPVFAPKGRMARRMQGRVQKNNGVGAKDAATSAAAQSSTDNRDNEDGEESNEVEDEDEDEDEVVVAPKRRITKKSRTSTAMADDSDNEMEGTESGIQGSSSHEASNDADVVDEDEDDNDNDNELPNDLLKSNKFLELVEKKKAERLAKEAAEEEKKKQRIAEQEALFGEGNDSDENDSEVDDRLTQSTRGKQRPQRKATKIAQLEMQKETQRLARNSQLNVVPEVAKKHSLQSFFDVFNYKPQTGNPFSKQALLPTPPSSSSPSAEGELAKGANTVTETSEDSGNPFIMDDQEVQMETDNTGADNDEELPNIDDLMDMRHATKEQQPTEGKETNEQSVTHESPAKKLDKGKGKATPEDLKKQTAEISTRPLRVAAAALTLDDSDDDLEIVKPTINLKGKSFSTASSDKPSVQAKALHDLRRLSGVNSREDSKQFEAKLRHKQLMVNLAKKSREQAKLAEEEKKAELRAQGHYIPTEEELRQDKAAAEDIWEKHQTEAKAIRDREKRDEAREKGVRISELTDDSENDSDWLEGGSGEEDDIDLSGSEDEEEVEEEDFEGNKDAMDEAEDETASVLQEDEPPSAQGTPRISDMPEAFIEDEADEADHSGADDSADEAAKLPKQKSSRRKRAVIADDESEDESEDIQVESSMPEHLPLSDLGTAPPMMGLTQMFNGSMPSQVVQASGEDAPESNIPLAGLGTQDVPIGLTQMFEASMPAPPKNKKPMDALRGTPGDFIMPPNPEYGKKDTNDETQFPIDLAFSQSQVQYEPESMLPDFYPSQMSQFPDPTPDTGFQSHLVPAPPRFGSAQPEEPTQNSANKSGGTESTIVMSPTQEQQPQKKGRLVRRLPAEDKGESEDAFTVMKKAAARPADDFDKSRSNAKEMIEEDAEESEDEYAGLGGRSDDEDEEGASDLEGLIDDDGEERVNERKVAGLFRKMEGEDDMRNVQDLMKRLENGGLKRRRAGGLFDLSDSEDESERLQRVRRRKEARLRSELLKETGISEVANNPKANAFFTTLENNLKDEAHFLDQEEEIVEVGQARRPLEPTSANNAAALAESQGEVETESQAKKRRRMKAKSIADVKRSVSNLLEDYTSTSLLQVEEDEEDEDEDGTALFKRRRFEIDDRIALKRNGTMTSETTRMAFHSASVETKLPALLRRSTTSQLSEVTHSKGGSSSGVGVTAGRTGGAASGARASASINWCQRESSRRKLVEKHTTDKKTEQKKIMGKRRQGISGIVGQGGFS